MRMTEYLNSVCREERRHQFQVQTNCDVVFALVVQENQG
jgi:hypothetical protein